jgi:lipopolysaccharide biosynthesis glycosyltransferase
VAFSCDSRKTEFFRHGLLVAIRSVRATNPQLEIVVLHNGLTPAQERSLDGSGCTARKIGEGSMSAPHRSDLTDAVYFKLRPELLPEWDRILFLDADLVVVDNLDDAFDFDGAFACRRERYDLAHDFRDPQRVRERDGLENNSRFLNSGVLCVNREKWIQTDCPNIATAIYREYGAEFFKCADQGVLNILAHRIGGFCDLDVSYNYCRWPDMMLSLLSRGSCARSGYRSVRYPIGTGRYSFSRYIPPMGPLGRDAVVIHWNGPGKPWEDTFRASQSRLWQHFHAECYEQFRSVKTNA